MRKVLRHYWQKLKHLRRKQAILVIGTFVFVMTSYALILRAVTLDNDTASSEPGISLASSSSSDENVSQVASEPATSSTLASSSAISSLPSTQIEAQEQSSAPATIQEATTLTADGDGYTVSAVFDASSRLPVGVELKVKQVTSDSQDYQNALAKAQAALDGKSLAFATFFDISFTYQGKEVQPQAPVKVTLQTKDNLAGQEQALKVVHITSAGKTELINPESVSLTESQTKVTYTVSSFSVQGLVLEKTEQSSEATTSDTESSSSETSPSSQGQGTSTSATTTEAAENRTLTFVYENAEGQEETITTVTKKDGETLENLPATPFKTGYHFDHWQNKATGETVTADTVVNGDMTIEAVYTEIKIYTVTVHYYYHNTSKGDDVTFDTEIYQLEANETPYRINPPASTKVSKNDDSSLPQDATYYPETALIELTKEELLEKSDADGKMELSIQYVPASSEYNIHYMLKDFDDKGYSEIEKVTAHGVIGSIVSPKVLDYPYATFEKTDPEELTKEKGQDLYVYYTRNHYTLNYESNGGTYVDYQTGLYNQSVSVTSATPTRVGYTFAGWYKDPDFKQKAGTSVTLDKDVTLYAKWEPKNVHYTVVYLKEKYDNATGKTSFEYDSSLSQTGKTGATVSASNAPNITTSTTGYERDTAQNATSETTIAADGSSILKVYYKLIRYTFVFNANGPVYDRVYYYEYMNNGKITINGYEYVNKTYTIDNVVLGQDISTTWPSGTQVSSYDMWASRYSFYGWLPIKNNVTVGNAFYVTKQFEVTADLVKAADSQHKVTYQSYWLRHGYSYTVNYYLQDENGNYQLSDKYSQTFYSLQNTYLNPKEIDGFDYSHGNAGENNVRVYNFYYNRKQYQIDYYNKDQELTSKKNILFGANINNDTYNWTPERPGDVDSDYTWKGWYMDADLTTPYQFNVMPSSHLVLYANWEAPHYTVSFDVNGGDSKAPESQSIEKYKSAQIPSKVPTKAHYTFAGWYTSDGKLYDWSKPVTSDVTLYAHWKADGLTYTVKYVDADDNDNLLAPTKIVSSPDLKAGQTVTEKALGIKGYLPEEREQLLMLNYDQDNEIVFKYFKKTDTITYTVKYVLYDHPDIAVAAPQTKTVSGSQIDSKEKAAAVDKAYMKKQAGVTDDMLKDNYYTTEDVQKLILTSKTENNIITFYYIPYDKATITVNYLDMDGNPIVGQDPDTVIKNVVPTSYKGEHKKITGYSFDRAEDGNGKAITNLDGYYVGKGGNYTINLYYKKNITLVAKPKEKIYDGTALESSKPTDLVDNYEEFLEEGNSIQSVSFKGSQTSAGVSDVTPRDAKIVDQAGEDNTDYYKITYMPSTLTVNQRPVVVNIKGQSKENYYDGTVQSITYDTPDISDNMYTTDDFKFLGEDSEKTVAETNAGHYDLALEGKFVNTNPNFKVTFHVTDGSLDIKRRRILLKSDSAQKGFDGTALTAHKVTETLSDTSKGEGFALGEGLEYEFTGSQTKVGASGNFFTFKPITDKTNPANYYVMVKYGELSVLPTVNIQKTDANWKPLSGGQFTIDRWNDTDKAWEAIDGVSKLTITSSNGVTIPTGLTDGRYRITETAAPDGYIVLDDAIYFKVEQAIAEGTDEQGARQVSYSIVLSDKDGNVISTDKVKLSTSDSDFSYRLQIANQAGTALPSTGGSGTLWYIVIGSLLMTLSFAYFMFKKCRNG